MKIKFFYFLLLLFYISEGGIYAQTLDCDFKRNLYLGSRGQDVACLQNYLKENGFFSYFITGIYDLKTKQAVKKWQELNKIYPANGNFTISARNFFKKNYYQKLKEKLLTKIDQKDIIIDETNGLSRFEDYYQKVFIEITPAISSTTFSRFFTVDEPFSLLYLIEKTIRSSDNFEINTIKEKNKIFKDFFEQRISKLKGISIKSNLKDFHLALLLNDLISLDLSSKFDDYLNNKITLFQFQNDLNSFHNQFEFIKRNYVDSIFSQLEKNNNQRLITRFFNFLSENKIFNFFISKQVSAFTSGVFPFGGRIIKILFCPCSFGRLIFISQPLPPLTGALYAPFGIEASPTVFLYKNLYTPGVWLLGSYLPSTIPCMQFGFFACYPIGFGSQIFIVGTSPTP